MSDFSLKIVGHGAFEKSIAKKYKKLKNREPFHRNAVIELDKWKNKNFEEEGKLAMDGGWKPLAAATIAARKRGGDKILQDTADLKNKWKMFWDKQKGVFSSSMPYGMFHHKHKKHPRRILPTEKQALQILKKILAFEIRNILK